MGLLWQSSTQKAVNWQGWISVAYLKSRALWKEGYLACMVGSMWYYLVWVFKPHIDTQCRLILSTAATCTWKSKKMPCTCQSEKHCASP